MLHQVTGRQVDIIETPDGRQVSGVFFPHLFKEFPAVERFQVVQEAPNRVQIRMVLNRGWSESDRRLLVSELGKVLGPEVDVDLLPVDDIPLTMTGKHRVVVRTIQTSANGRVEST